MSRFRYCVGSPITLCLLAAVILGVVTLLTPLVTSATPAETPTATPTATPTPLPGTLELRLLKPDLPKSCTTCGVASGRVNFYEMPKMVYLPGRTWEASTVMTWSLPPGRYGIEVSYFFDQCKPNAEAPSYTYWAMSAQVVSNQTTSITPYLPDALPGCHPVEPPEPSTILLTGSGLSIAVAGYYLNRWRQRLRK